VVQCGAVCCSVLQCVDCHNFNLVFTEVPDLYVAVCCIVLQRVDCHNFNQVFTGVPDLYVAVCCNVLQYVAVWCSVLQCFAVCCRVLQSTYLYTHTDSQVRGLSLKLSFHSLQQILQHCKTHCNTATLQRTLQRILQRTDLLECWCVCALFLRAQPYYVYIIFDICGVPQDQVQHTATHCNTLQHITHYDTLQHTAIRLHSCNFDIRGVPQDTPQHTATHCNTLHHAAFHMNS